MAPTVRIPLAITQSLARKRDDLSRKITEAHAQEHRKEWGPEVELSREEADWLANYATEIRKDPMSPVKMVSAANKLLDVIEKMRMRTRMGAAMPEKEIGPISTIDEVMERFTQGIATPGQPAPPQSAPAAPTPRPIEPPVRHPAEPLAEVAHKIYAEASDKLNLLVDQEVDSLPPRQAAMVRLEILYELLRVERPAFGAVLAKAIKNIKAI